METLTPAEAFEELCEWVAPLANSSVSDDELHEQLEWHEQRFQPAWEAAQSAAVERESWKGQEGAARIVRKAIRRRQANAGAAELIDSAPCIKATDTLQSYP